MASSAFDFQFITQGNMDFVVNMIHGVARIFNPETGSIWSYIVLMGVLSVFYNYLVLPTKDKPTDPGKSFITGILLTWLLMGPETLVTVTVEDASSTAVGVESIENVPFILGLGGQIATGIVHQLNEEIKIAFQSPSGAVVSGGVADPLQALMKVRNMELTNPRVCQMGNSSVNVNFCTSFNYYLEDCVKKDLSQDNSEINLAELKGASLTQYWEALRVSYSNHNTVSTFVASLPQGEVLDCPTAYNKLTANLDGGYFKQALVAYAESIGINMTELAKTMSLHFSENLNSGTPQTQAYMLVRTRLLDNLVKSSLATGEIPNISDVSTFQAREQRKIQMASNTSMWLEMARPLATFFEGFAIFLTPIMALLMIIGGNSVQSSITYFGMLLWVALWPLILTAVNLYTDWVVTMAFETKSSNDINYFAPGSLDSTFTTVESYLAQAGVLTSLVPTLALFVIYRGVHTMLSAAGKAAPSTNIDAKLPAPDITSAANAGKFDAQGVQATHNGGGFMFGAQGSPSDYRVGNINMGNSVNANHQKAFTAAQADTDKALSTFNNTIGEKWGITDKSTESYSLSDGKTADFTSHADAMQAVTKGLNLAYGLNAGEGTKLASTITAGLQALGTGAKGGFEATQMAQATKQLQDQEGENGSVSTGTAARYQQAINYLKKNQIDSDGSKSEDFSTVVSQGNALERAIQQQESANAALGFAKGADFSKDIDLNAMGHDFKNNWSTGNDGSTFNTKGSVLEGLDVNKVLAQAYGGDSGAYKDMSADEKQQKLAGLEDKLFGAADKETADVVNSRPTDSSHQESIKNSNRIGALFESFVGRQDGENFDEFKSGHGLASQMFANISDASGGVGGSGYASTALAGIASHDLTKPLDDMDQKRVEQPLTKREIQNDAAAIKSKVADRQSTTIDSAAVDRQSQENLNNIPTVPTTGNNENISNVSRDQAADNKRILDKQNGAALMLGSARDMSEVMENLFGNGEESQAQSFFANTALNKDEANGLAILAQNESAFNPTVMSFADGSGTSPTNQAAFIQAYAASLNPEAIEDFKAQMIESGRPDLANNIDKNTQALEKQLDRTGTSDPLINDSMALGSLVNDGRGLDSMGHVLKDLDSNPNSLIDTSAQDFNNAFQAALPEGAPSGLKSQLEQRVGNSKIHGSEDQLDRIERSILSDTFTEDRNISPQTLSVASGINTSNFQDRLDSFASTINNHPQSYNDLAALQDLADNLENAGHHEQASAINTALDNISNNLLSSNGLRPSFDDGVMYDDVTFSESDVNKLAGMVGREFDVQTGGGNSISFQVDSLSYDGASVSGVNITHGDSTQTLSFDSGSESFRGVDLLKDNSDQTLSFNSQPEQKKQTSFDAGVRPVELKNSGEK